MPKLDVIKKQGIYRVYVDPFSGRAVENYNENLKDDHSITFTKEPQVKGAFAGYQLNIIDKDVQCEKVAVGPSDAELLAYAGKAPCEAEVDKNKLFKKKESKPMDLKSFSLDTSSSSECICLDKCLEVFKLKYVAFKAGKKNLKPQLEAIGELIINVFPDSESLLKDVMNQSESKFKLE